jgi:pimeloyl-ACP methyl ester carboxylesterase
MKREVIHTRFGTIEYSSAGQGIPVLFIHGGHSNCHERLCHKGFDLEKFQLITPSRPGYGQTPLANNSSPEQAAGLIAALAEHLSLHSMIVYGISAGGLTAIALAANYPDKVARLILASAVTKKWLDEQGAIYKTAQRIFNPKTAPFTWGMVRLASKVFPNMIAKSFYPQFSKKAMHKLRKEDVQELIAALQHYASKKGFLNDIGQNIADELIRKVKCPTLIVHSEHDNSVPFEHALHANKMIETATLIKLDNEWGHLFWLGEDSKKPIDQILAFISQ